jgi:hypothetical protein
MLKGFFDSSLKNDEVLLKILQLFQKAAEKASASNDNDTNFLSEKDIQQLFNEVTIIPVKDQKKIEVQ